ncbi:MAG: hypothetical protein ACE5JJ_05935 [Nitrospinota bacterium]
MSERKVSCEVYGIGANPIPMEVEERYLRPRQVFEFEGERYFIVRVQELNSLARVNVLPLSHRREGRGPGQAARFKRPPAST